jgi:hypothetical protein
MTLPMPSSFILAKIRHEIKTDTGSCAVEKAAVNGENDHENKERGHHEFGDALNSVLNAKPADKKTEHADKDRPEGLSSDICQSVAEDRTDLIGVHPDKGSADVQITVSHHPPGDRRIIHHQHIAADNTDPFEPVPSRSSRLGHLKSLCRTLLCSAADGKFADHDRNSHNGEKHEIDHDKSRSAVLSTEIRKFPHISDPDGASGRNKYKAKARTEFLTLCRCFITHLLFPSDCNFRII